MIDDKGTFFSLYIINFVSCVQENVLILQHKYYD